MTTLDTIMNGGLTIEKLEELIDAGKVHFIRARDGKEETAIEWCNKIPEALGVIRLYTDDAEIDEWGVLVERAESEDPA